MRRDYTFVCAPIMDHSPTIDQGVDRCIALTGDYITIATDFRSGVRNVVWGAVHEHMLKTHVGDDVYRRGRQTVAWAADFIFLDLPFGGALAPHGARPAWDTITKEHVRCGVHLAHSTLED